MLEEGYFEKKYADDPDRGEAVATFLAEHKAARKMLSRPGRLISTGQHRTANLKSVTMCLHGHARDKGWRWVSQSKTPYGLLRGDDSTYDCHSIAAALCVMGWVIGYGAGDKGEDHERKPRNLEVDDTGGFHYRYPGVYSLEPTYPNELMIMNKFLILGMDPLSINLYPYGAWTDHRVWVYKDRVYDAMLGVENVAFAAIRHHYLAWESRSVRDATCHLGIKFPATGRQTIYCCPGEEQYTFKAPAPQPATVTVAAAAPRRKRGFFSKRP